MQTERYAQAEFLSQAATGHARRVTRRSDTLTVHLSNGGIATFRGTPDSGVLRLDSSLPKDRYDAASIAVAALEASFAWAPERLNFKLDIGSRSDVGGLMADRGEIHVAEGGLVASVAMLMQRAAPWLAKGDQPAFPTVSVVTGQTRHPLRPAKPDGIVYARYIPWLDQTLSFRALELDTDLTRFNRWMNDPRVAAFWNEAGDLDVHRRYLETLLADPHMFPMIGEIDGFGFAYFEIYWAKENRLGPFYDVDDYDRGWHVAVGEASCLGGAFIGAWLPSLMHYLFLDDCRTRRIVGEPATAHHQQIRNLERSGFDRIKTFDFPHKNATLVSLPRERFFEHRLWNPAPKAASRDTHRAADDRRGADALISA